MKRAYENWADVAVPCKRTTARHLLLRIARPLLLICFCASSWATMIVIVKSPDGYWIAADGVRSGQGVKTSEVCKIHETPYGIVIKLGASQGFRTDGEEYSTDTVLKDALASNHDLSDLELNIRNQYLADVTEELVYTSHTPYASVANLPALHFLHPVSKPFQHGTGRGLIAIDFLHGEQPIRFLEVIGGSISHSQQDGSFYTYGAFPAENWVDIFTLGGTESGKVNPPGVRMFGFLVDYPRSSEWINAHPKEAALEMLTKGNATDPSFVGPPYSLLHISFPVAGGRLAGPGRVEWVERGKCPSWTQEIRPDPMRDEY